MSRFGSWFPNALAVIFAATVMGGSLLLILQEREARRPRSTMGSEIATGDPAPPGLDEALPAGKEPVSIDEPSGGRLDSNARNSHSPQNSASSRFGANSAGAAAPPEINTIRTLPRTDAELAAAFDRAEQDACELLPGGEPLEITSFTPYLTQRDRQSARLAPSLRRSAFAIGLQLPAEEQQRLPLISRSRIAGYLQNHYVSVQARIQRDPRTGIRYLHHRPLSAAAKFSGARLTQEPEAAVAASVHDFRSLGLLVEGDGTPSLEDLRTLVLVHKHAVLRPSATGPASFQPNYEFAFIHASRADLEGSEPLTLDAFVTSGGRERLHHLRSRAPTGPSSCGIRANVRLSEFTYGGTYPTRAIVRDVAIADRSSFSWKQLDAFANDQGWSGDAWDHLPEIFHAIIDARVSLTDAHGEPSR